MVQIGYTIITVHKSKSKDTLGKVISVRNPGGQTYSDQDYKDWCVEDVLDRLGVELWDLCAVVSDMNELYTYFILKNKYDV